MGKRTNLLKTRDGISVWNEMRILLKLLLLLKYFCFGDDELHENQINGRFMGWKDEPALSNKRLRL
jgi:hypothetical protein